MDNQKLCIGYEQRTSKTCCAYINPSWGDRLLLDRVLFFDVLEEDRCDSHPPSHTQTFQNTIQYESLSADGDMRMCGKATA